MFTKNQNTFCTVLFICS